MSYRKSFKISLRQKVKMAERLHKNAVMVSNMVIHYQQTRKLGALLPKATVDPSNISELCIIIIFFYLASTTLFLMPLSAHHRTVYAQPKTAFYQFNPIFRFRSSVGGCSAGWWDWDKTALGTISFPGNRSWSSFGVTVGTRERNDAVGSRQFPRYRGDGSAILQKAGLWQRWFWLN